jgi:hypothetical protein
MAGGRAVAGDGPGARASGRLLGQRGGGNHLVQERARHRPGGNERA